MVPAFVHMKSFLNPVPTSKRFFLSRCHGQEQAMSRTQAPNHPPAYAEKGQVGLSCSPTREEETTVKPQAL